jgi:hypothetical protein
VEIPAPENYHPCFYRTKGEFRQAVLGSFSRLDELGHDLAYLLERFHLFESQATL